MLCYNFVAEVEPLYYTNFDLINVVTSVDADMLGKLLEQSNYDERETEFLVKGFKSGFELGYCGKKHDIQCRAPNLKLRVGNETILWNKIMKEVKLKRYAGPYRHPLFTDFTQSPVGLVPKSNGDISLVVPEGWGLCQFMHTK